MKKNNSKVYFLNAAPTLIEVDGKKYVVFTHCSQEYTMGVYLHDIEGNRTLCRFAACEVFIDFMEDKRNPGNGRFFFLTDRALAKGLAVDSMTAGFGNWLSNDKLKEDHELIVLGVNFDFNTVRYSPEKVIDEIELKENEGKKFYDLSCGATSSFMPLCAIDDEDQRWQDRYYRDSIVEVTTNKAHAEEGYFDEFTIIFKENFAETFKLQADSQAKSAEEQEANPKDGKDGGDKKGGQEQQQQQ